MNSLWCPEPTVPPTSINCSLLMDTSTWWRTKTDCALVCLHLFKDFFFSFFFISSSSSSLVGAWVGNLGPIPLSPPFTFSLAWSPLQKETPLEDKVKRIQESPPWRWRALDIVIEMEIILKGKKHCLYLKSIQPRSRKYWGAIHLNLHPPCFKRPKVEFSIEIGQSHIVSVDCFLFLDH